MKLSDVFSKALFKTPKYNVFPQPNEVKFTGRIGKLYPVQRWLMNPGDSIDVNLQQLIRFAPLTAPIMHNFQVDFQAIEIPDRLAIPYIGDGMEAGQLDGGFENFHNLNRSRDITMPYISLLDLLEWYVYNKVNPIGSIFDFLGYPTFSDLYRYLADNGVFDNSLSPFMDSVPYTYVDTTPQPSVYWLNDNARNGGVAGRVSAPSVVALPFEYQNMSINPAGTNVPSYRSFVSWLLIDKFDIAPNSSVRQGYFKYWFDHFNIPYNTAEELTVITVPDFEGEVIEDAPYTDESGFQALAAAICAENDFPMTKAIEEYTSAVFFEHLRMVAFELPDRVDDSKHYSLLPLYAFWSAYYDWFINTNIEATSSNDNKLTWLIDEVGLMFHAPEGDDNYLTDYGTGSFLPGELPDRKWADDYFTSAFLEPAQGGNVLIPSGTIQDLRNANSLQKLYEKLMYSGRRYIDQVLGIFGVHSSNERLDRCRVLGVAHFGVNVSDVTQTSQDTDSARLGDYAGNAITVGQNRSFIHYTAEEHSTIMVFMSVRPKGVYMDETPKDLFKLSPYDFLIPELAHVGEQPVLSTEIVPEVTCSENAPSIFGYQRRYSEYMYSPSHVHGEMRTSLRYWNAARIFDDGVPTLNSQFISVDDQADDLNRIFAVPDANENLRCFLYFDTVISRPLSKFVEYHL